MRSLVHLRTTLFLVGALLLATGVLFAQADDAATPEGSAPPPVSEESVSEDSGEATGWLDSSLEAWKELGEIPQTAIAVVLFFFVFVLARRWITRRLVRAAAATENDLDDRFAHFLRQFSGIATIFLFALPP